jgi:hypothetical protein
MAQANVAREPSMEEILASIRKIIESNDPAEEQDVGLGGQVEQGADAGDTDESERPLSLLNKISEAAKEPAAVPEAKMDDAAGDLDKAMPFASLRTGLEDTEPSSQAVEEVDMAEVIKADNEPEVAVSLASVAAEVSAAAVEEAVVDDVRDEEDTEEPPVSEVVVLPAANRESDADVEDEIAADVVAEPDDEADATAEEGRALISPEAGARVAASFGNLNHAVSNGPTRSFDEIAEDMLRPMLQQWLDDNLPTLVERLVREEIERVARGG